MEKIQACRHSRENASARRLDNQMATIFVVIRNCNAILVLTEALKCPVVSMFTLQ